MNKMKAITKLMNNECYFNADLLEILVTMSIFVFCFIINFIILLFIDFTRNQFIANCIGLTMFILFYHENKITDFIEEHSINRLCSDNENCKSKDVTFKPISCSEDSCKSIDVKQNEEIDYLSEFVDVMPDKIPKIAFDIVGVIKSVPNRSHSKESEKTIIDVISCVSEIIHVFGKENVYFIGSGSSKEEWITKAWLEINGLVEETNMLRKNILFVKSDSDSKLSYIDEEKRKLCVELGITHYVDDREQATHILSQSIPFTILYSSSQFEQQLLFDNLPEYDNIRMEHTNNINNLKNIIIDNYDRYFNRKTHFKPKINKNSENYINPYYLEQQDKKYVIVPFDKNSAPSNLKCVSFLILYDENNVDWVNLGDPFTAGYISNNGVITFNTEMNEVCL